MSSLRTSSTPELSIIANHDAPSNALLQAIFAEEPHDVKALLEANTELASSCVTHYAADPDDEEGRYGHAPDASTEPAVIFAARVPLYKEPTLRKRTVSVQIMAIVQLLVDHGACLLEVSEADEWSQRALSAACSHYDSPEMMLLLLRAGAVMPSEEGFRGVWSMKGGVRNDAGWMIRREYSPGDWTSGGLGFLAGSNGHTRTVNFLMESGLRFTPFERGVFDFPSSRRPGTEQGARICMSASAVIYGRDEVITLLLQRLDEPALTRKLETKAKSWNPRVIDAWLICAVDKICDPKEDGYDVGNSWPWELPDFLARRERIVHRLLDHGASPTTQNDIGNTVLYSACRWAGTSVIDRLIEASESDVNNTRPYLNPWQSQNIHTDFYASGLQFTALHLAAAYHNLDAVKSLLAAGASAQVPDENNRTALHWALIARRDHFRAKILYQGDTHADPNKDGCQQALSVWSRPLDIIAELLPLAGDVNAADGFGRTPLHYAAMSFLWKVMNALLRNGADFSLRDSEGNTPAFYMASTLPLWSPHMTGLGISEGYLWGLRMLQRQIQSSGSSIDVDARCADGETALIRACRRANIPVVECLLSLDAKPNIADFAGWTAVHHAAACHCESGRYSNNRSKGKARASKMKQLLRDAGADESLTDKMGMTAADVLEALEATDWATGDDGIRYRRRGAGRGKPMHKHLWI